MNMNKDLEVGEESICRLTSLATKPTTELEPIALLGPLLLLRLLLVACAFPAFHLPACFILVQRARVARPAAIGTLGFGRTCSFGLRPRACCVAGIPSI